MSFEKFALHGSLLRAIKDAGYETPTDIQEKALPPALEGRDVLGCAMTGSGKTAAFVLPILERLFKRTRGVTRALILCPTRELAMQIHETILELGKYAPVKSATVFGGVPMKGQVQAFERGVDILIATPGRLMDHFQYNYAKLNSLEVLVFDEADRMLDMGFLPSIKKILQHIPKPQQTLFFSATMPSQIGQLAKDLLNRPITFNVERQAKPATGITQSSYPVPQRLKPALLLELLAQNPIESAIVFTRTKHRANGLQKYLAGYGVNCERIHGNRSQAQRTEALKGFKSGKYRVLVATDIAARGIDVQDLEYVINFDVPAIPEDYIHRVGRTARAERTGEALTFFSKEEEGQLFDIERAIGLKLPREWVDGFNYKAVGEKMTVDRGDTRQGDPRRNAPRRSPQVTRGKSTQAVRGQGTQAPQSPRGNAQPTRDFVPRSEGQSAAPRHEQRPSNFRRGDSSRGRSGNR